MDGKQLAYIDESGIKTHLVIRELNRFETKQIPGAEDDHRPFFSPDGRWLAYSSGTSGIGDYGALMKIPSAGGSPIKLCDGMSSGMGSWGEDGTIVFAANEGNLSRVSASGGPCEPITKAEPGEGHRFPQFLPSGQHVLFTIGRTGEYDGAQIALLDLKTREFRVLIRGGSFGRYVPTGHIVYVRGGTLFAIPFDLEKLAVAGQEVPVIERVHYNSVGGYADYTFSNSGLLAYTEETRTAAPSTLEWRNRKGIGTAALAPPQQYNNIRISPDGFRAAANVTGDGATSDVWTVDLQRGTANRLTSRTYIISVGWTPDGRSILFYQKNAVMRAAADGSGSPEVAFRGLESPVNNIAVSPDGKTLLFDARNIFIDGPDGKPQLLFGRSDSNNGQAVVSADGKWVAYSSDESGKYQVYVRPFFGSGGKVAVSIDGGQEPRWSRDGRELFFRDAGKNLLMEVPIQASSGQSLGQAAAEFHAGQPQALFGLDTPVWDVAPDGQRFLVAHTPAAAPPSAVKLNVVVNWFDELREKVPTGK